MTLRRILFWSHLTAGLIAGIFILIMSVTGILLTHSNGITNAVHDSVTINNSAGEVALTIDELAKTAFVHSNMGERGISLSLDNREGAPIIVKSGRSVIGSVSPYTGDEIANPSHALSEFYHFVTQIHRWLGATGEARGIARAVNGAANLAFLFLIISGLYLWLPKVMKWSFIKLKLFFRRSYPTTKARDYNWHHVFGVWALIPLFFIVTSGAVFYYPWANALVYKAFGEDAPKRRGPPGGGASSVEIAADNVALTSFEDAFSAIQKADATRWTRIDITVPKNPQQTQIEITRHQGDRLLPRQRKTYQFDRLKGEIANVRTIDESSPGQRARIFIRFLHTGEVFGPFGSMIAGFASLASVFLIWTGTALAWRRLIQPKLRRRVSTE